MSTPKKTKFLLCVDSYSKELYILHRENPQCLFWVKQEIPVILVLIEIYDDFDLESILNMPFIKEAKDFFKKQAETSFNDN